MFVSIVNQPMGNRGDESAHRAFLRSLSQRFPDYSFQVVDVYHSKEMIDSITVKASNVSYVSVGGFTRGFTRAEQAAFVLGKLGIAELHPAVAKLGKIIKASDAVICAPGGICMGGFMDWNHIYQLLLARIYKKPVFYWGRSIGPFTDEDYKHRLFKKYANQVLHYASDVFLRDTESVKIAQAMGVQAISMVDSAFLDVPDPAIPSEISAAIGSNPYMIFVPNSLTWHYRYKGESQKKIDSFYYKIFDLIKSAHPDWKIVMLPQTYQSAVNDYRYFKHLAKAYENSKGKACDILVIDENQSSDIQQKIIAGSNLVIGARYHSVVFAINNARPFVSLSYEHKMSGLLETLGLTQYMVQIQDIFDKGSEALFLQALDSIKQKIAIAASTPKETSQAKQIVKAAFKKLCAELPAVAEV